MMKTNKARVVTSTLIDSILSDVDKTTARKIENQMEISARIADLMRANKVSSSDLATRLNKKGQSEITKWLSGTHNFTIDTISAIEVALNGSILTKRVENTIVCNFQVVTGKVNIGRGADRRPMTQARIFQNWHYNG